MSFWDIVTDHDPEMMPPSDKSAAAQTAAGITGAALAVAATAVAALYAPSSLSTLGRSISIGGRAASNSLRSGMDARDQVTEQNERNAARRRELGLRFLERASERNPDNLVILCRLARARFANGQANGALKASETAYSKDPSNIEARLLTAYFSLALSQNERARALLSSIDHVRAEGWLLAGLADRLPKPSFSELEEKVWRWITENDPNNAIAWQRRGYFYEAKNRLADATEHYERASIIDGTMPRPWETAFSNATRAMEEGRGDDARALYNRARSFKPLWVDPILQLGILSVRESKTDEAISLFITATKFEPENGRAFLLLGNTYKSKNELAAAREAWNKAFELNTELPVPWVLQANEAKSRIAARDYDGARQQLDEADKSWSGWRKTADLRAALERKIEAENAEKLGDQAILQRQYDVALKHWQEAIALDSTSCSPMLKIGAVVADRGDLSEALPFFQRASDLGDARAASALQLCRIYYDFVPELGPQV
ncbi:tetratricopeptide repeat protein [Granulicella cerasi]|uniref:Tetratricopeptide repeat protein n=1 Tax=Granulicella cerasi TaxID=741063 RepID=A0ABW1ZAT9_9BACT|nr:tetratricopeptide repeat protein [Granulicella cerasi]